MRQLRGIEIAASLNQLPNPRFNLLPAQAHLAVRVGEAAVTDQDALRIVILGNRLACDGGICPADAIFLLEESGVVLRRFSFLELGIDPHLPLADAAAAGQDRINVFLGNGKGGSLFRFRLRDIVSLFFFCWERRYAQISSRVTISSAEARMLFIAATQAI